jgi:hypothetical protein
MEVGDTGERPRCPQVDSPEPSGQIIVSIERLQPRESEMLKSKFMIIGSAIAAASLALGAVALARAMPPNYPLPPGMGASYALFPVTVPQGSNRVGIFVARRLGAQANVYYCSSPIDALSKDAGGCREIKGFPNR